MAKEYGRESYEEALSNKEIEKIKQSLEEVKQGKFKSIEQVAKELGITLK